MGNSNSLVVQLESGSQQHSVFPGGEIAGVLHANLTEGLTLGDQKIFIELTGKEHAHWTTSEGSGDNRRTRHHHRTCAVAGLPIRLIFGQHMPGEQLQGQFSYPFNIVLPYNLPPTFYHKYRNGHAEVRYKIHAELHRKGMMKRNLRFNTEVYIAPSPHIPPTLNVLAPQSIELRGERSVLTCCCIPRGDVSLQVKMPRTYFEKGELMMLTANAANNSAVNVDKIKIQLRRIVSVSGHGHTTNLANVVADGIPAGNTKENLQLQLTVPDFSAQNTGFIGQIISCQYQLKISMDIPWAPDLDLSHNVWFYERGAISRAVQAQQMQAAQAGGPPAQVVDHSGGMVGPYGSINVEQEQRQLLLKNPEYKMDGDVGPPPAYAPPTFGNMPPPKYDDGDDGFDEAPHWEQPPPGWEPTVYEPVKYKPSAPPGPMGMHDASAPPPAYA